MLYSHTARRKKAVFGGWGVGGWGEGGRRVLKLWKARNISYEFVEYGQWSSTLLCFLFIRVSHRLQQMLSFCKSAGGYLPLSVCFLFSCIVIMVLLMSEECPVMCLHYWGPDNVLYLRCIVQVPKCSTTGKPTHLFRTKCVSLDSV
jgi:hypothetical protein